MTSNDLEMRRIGKRVKSTPSDNVQPPTRRGRPNADRAKSIDAAILNAARHHFTNTGYERTTMDAIAATASVGKPTLYTRYPTKEALHRAVVTRELQALSRRAEARIKASKSTDLKRRLQRRAREIITGLVSTELGALLRLVGDNAVPTEDVARILDREHRASIKLIERDIIEGSKNFRAPPTNPEKAAEMLMGSLYGWWLPRSQGGPIPLDDAMDYADYAVDVFFAGRTNW